MRKKGVRTEDIVWNIHKFEKIEVKNLRDKCHSHGGTLTLRHFRHISTHTHVHHSTVAAKNVMREREREKKHS